MTPLRLAIDARLDYRLPDPADILLAIEAAPMADQMLVEDLLTVGTASPLVPVAGEEGIGRRTWTRGHGRFTAEYRALVDIVRTAPDWAALGAVPLTALPAGAIPYLWPSRYCQVERMKPFAHERFGGIAPGGPQVAAILEWAGGNLRYEPGCSDASTTAHDTFREGRGICRDFAHVMIALTRALDLPARMVSAYALDLDPPDFHAVVEVYLDGAWHLADPSGLAAPEHLVRIGVGRDATDISFMTIFGGSAELDSQGVTVTRAG